MTPVEPVSTGLLLAALAPWALCVLVALAALVKLGRISEAARAESKQLRSEANAVRAEVWRLRRFLERIAEDRSAKPERLIGLAVQALGWDDDRGKR